MATCGLFGSKSSAMLSANSQASGSGGVWPRWNTLYGTGSANASTVYQIPTTTLSAGDTVRTSVIVWAGWNCSYMVAPNVRYEYVDMLTPQSAAPAATMAVAHEVRRKARESADAKADRLLKTILSAEQRVQYERERAFDVIVGRTGERRRYRIKHGWAGNVFVVDDRGREVERLCIHPSVQVPIADNLVAQKLLLEADEATFRRTANSTRLVA